MRLNFEITGKEDGPSILLIHGFLSSNAQWLPNIEALGKDYKLIMVELWGHGESPTPGVAAFTLERYDHELERIRVDLDIDSWHLIGQSYAAGLVIRYGINHPGQTSRIVVTNSRSAFGDITKQQRPSPQTELDKSKAIDKSSNRHLPIHPIYAKRLPDDIKARLVDNADNISLEAIERGGLIGFKLNTLDILDTVSVPLLLTNGIYEKSFQSDAKAIKDNFKSVEVTDLPGGHAVNIEAATEFNAAVLNFFNY